MLVAAVIANTLPVEHIFRNYTPPHEEPAHHDHLLRNESINVRTCVSTIKKTGGATNLETAWSTLAAPY